MRRKYTVYFVFKQKLLGSFADLDRLRFKAESGSQCAIALQIQRSLHWDSALQTSRFEPSVFIKTTFHVHS